VVGAGLRWSSRETLLAGMSVSLLAPLLVFVDVLLLSSYGPAWLIPDLVPAALSPADDLANSRIEIQDPNVAMLFLACLAALVLTIASITGRRPAANTNAVTSTVTMSG